MQTQQCRHYYSNVCTAVSNVHIIINQVNVSKCSHYGSSIMRLVRHNAVRLSIYQVFSSMVACDHCQQDSTVSVLEWMKRQLFYQDYSSFVSVRLQNHIHSRHSGCFHWLYTSDMCCRVSLYSTMIRQVKVKPAFRC